MFDTSARSKGFARKKVNNPAFDAGLFTQMTKLLHELGQITTTEVFIDGTKIEASANKYTFV